MNMAVGRRVIRTAGDIVLAKSIMVVGVGPRGNDVLIPYVRGLCLTKYWVLLS